MSPAAAAATPDLQAIAESKIKAASDALNKRAAAGDATAQVLARHEGEAEATGHGMQSTKEKHCKSKPEPQYPNPQTPTPKPPNRFTGVLDDMKHGLAFLLVKSNTLLADPKVGSKMVKENTTSFSKLFGDTIAKGMSKVVGRGGAAA